MHLNNLQALDLETIATVLPSTGQKLTTIITPEGVRREVEKGYTQKAQTVRVLDVMILGPAMVYAGMGKELPQGLKAMMLLTGLGTILYNGYNWFENEKVREQQEALAKARAQSKIKR